MKQSLLIACLLALSAADAGAHSDIETTVPANGAVLGEAPAEIELEFAKPIRVTRIQLTVDQGAPVDLDLGEQASFATRIQIPFPAMGSGSYRIEWRGLADDGHTMRGELEFEVR